MANRLPENKNFLSPLGFKFQINKLPDMNFFVQSVVLPSIDVGNFDQPTPFRMMPTVGDHLEYGDLEVTFRVNESMSNYIEIFNWMMGIGFPDNFDQRKDVQSQTIVSGQGLYSDATLTVLSSAMNPSVDILIKDLFPISLSSLRLDSTMVDVEYVEATVTFKFLNFTIKKL